MSNKIIELKGITKTFDDQQVLKGIDLNIYENEFLTLLGPSGCGKTTLLRILGGFESADNGEVLFNGKDIAKVPPYKREINTVFQKYALFPHLNVYDNIAFGLKLKKTPKQTIEKKVKAALKMVGMTDYEYRDVDSLSGGQQQRVAIARALASDAHVLLADEPTGNLDETTADEIIALLKKTAHELGKCVVVVTHSKHLAEEADEILEIKNGAISFLSD